MRKAPNSAKAAAEGTLSPDQADALAGAITEENADAFAEQEDRLIEEAKESLDAAIEAANRFRESSGESAQERADRLHAARSASTWVGDDGMLHGRQALAGDDGATFRNAFQAFVDREFRQGGADDKRTAAQRRADAAVEMARFAAAALNGSKPTSPSVPTVTTHLDYDDLLEAAGVGEDENTGLAVTGEAARRLACDANIVRLITRGRSEVIDVGRKTRTIPVPTRRSVIARDGGCTFPGCTAPPDWVQIHHIKHWAHLGETSLANLTSACGRHHHFAHEGGWQVTLDPATQRTIWHAPDGRVLVGQRRRSPDQHRAA
jgi:hypothetical protein